MEKREQAAVPDARRAVQAARCAQPGWSARTLRARLRVVRRVRHALAERASEFVEAVGQSERRGSGETVAAELLPLAEACRFLEGRAAD
ncbi:MAG: aldehyde dehydrogenase family protein [Thiohalospira sp.]